MAVSPVNISRISNNMRADFIVQSLRRTQRELFATQARFSSGRSFLTPSEDPVAAARALDLTQALDRQQQFKDNLRQGDNFLSAADSALVEINDLLNQASVIASQNIDNFSSPGQRQAEAELVSQIRQQLQTVANRSLGGRFLFAGRNTTQRPFVDALGGVAYVGDTGQLTVRSDVDTTAAIAVPGNLLFGALSAPLSTNVDLTPVLTMSTRLEDIAREGGTPVETGTLVINEIGGAGVFSVALDRAHTIGDVVDRINQAAQDAGSSLSATLTDTGLTITPGGLEITVTDTAAGSKARSLGVFTSDPTASPIVSDRLVPRLTRLTPVDALAGGAGIDLDGGLMITNGSRSATIDVSKAQTVQDIINAINSAGVFVLARINDAGSGIDVFNQVSGTSLTIGENGGTTAADLGLRTLNSDTLLSQLNFGRGVSALSGKDDFRITTKSGRTVDVNLDGAVTLGDVIDRINQAAADAGVAVTADLAAMGNGIRLQDGTGGNGDLSVNLLNLSTAAIDLGLVQTVSGQATTLLGRDVNPTRTEGVIGALIDLENGLRRDDTSAITQAGARLDDLKNETIRVQGVVGARSQAMNAKLAQMEDAAASTQQFLSKVQDLDFSKAAIELQSATTQLQANLQTSSNLLNLSLLSFLR